MTKKTSTGSFGASTTILAILNHDVLPNEMKDRYLDKGNPMKPFNNGTPDP